MTAAVASASPRAGVAAPAGAPPKENLVRATPEITVARATQDGMPTLTGHFAVWNQWTEIRSAWEGHFLERFAPTSMTRTLEQSTPKVLFQHGKDPMIGEKPLGTVRSLQPDANGAFYEVDLFDTAYNRELLPGLEANQYGASFRFTVVREDFVQRPKKSDYNPRGIPERTVHEARVAEFGPVTFPAYPGATAGVRSMTDEFLVATLASDQELPTRTGISLAGVRTPFDRADTTDISCLSSMLNLGACYLSEQDETDDAADIKAMTAILHQITSLIDGEIDEPAEPDTLPMAGMYGTDAEGDERAQWDTQYINDLPDSAFLHIEAGGSKDSDGKTTPRSLRHFPYKDSSGNVDMPHLRNALARIPQSSLPQSVKDAAVAKAEKLLAAENGRDTKEFADAYVRDFNQNRDISDPEPSEATTRDPSDPEPSEATTRSDSHGLFWFVETPKHLREG